MSYSSLAWIDKIKKVNKDLEFIADKDLYIKFGYDPDTRLLLKIICSLIKHDKLNMKELAYRFHTER